MRLGVLALVAVLLAPIAAAQDAGGGGSSGSTDPPASAARFIVGALETGVARGLIAENATRAADPVKQAWSRFNTSLAGAIPEVDAHRALVDPLFARTLAEAFALNASGVRIYGNAVEACIASALVTVAASEAAMGAIHAILSPKGSSKWLHEGAHPTELGAPPQETGALRAWLADSALVTTLRSEGASDPVFSRIAAGRALCLALAVGVDSPALARLETRRDEETPGATPPRQAPHVAFSLGKAFGATFGPARIANVLVAEDERAYAAAWARDPATAFARPCGLCAAGAVMEGVEARSSEASLVAGRETLALGDLMDAGEAPAALAARFAILRAVHARLESGSLERGPGIAIHVPPLLNGTNGFIEVPVTLNGGESGERFSFTLRAGGFGGATFAGFASSEAHVRLHAHGAGANASTADTLLDVVVDPWPGGDPVVVVVLNFSIPANVTAWSVAVEALRLVDGEAKVRPVSRSAGTDGFDAVGAVFVRGRPEAARRSNESGRQEPLHECGDGASAGMCAPNETPRDTPFPAALAVVALLVSAGLARNRRRAE